MKIALVTPAGPGTRNGNRHTALRWAAFLREAGHMVSVRVQWQGEPADLMIVLQPMAAEELSPGLRRKVRVVVQSSSTRLRHAPVARKFRICVIGHLRE